MISFKSGLFKTIYLSILCLCVLKYIQFIFNFQFIFPSSKINSCSCIEKHYVLKLHKPLHHFDSNHWFHICEYYLSRHDSFDFKDDSNISLSIITSEDSFIPELTQTTLFFLLLSFTNGRFSSVELFAPTELRLKPSRMISFESYGPKYTYSTTIPLQQRFYMKSPFQQPADESPTLTLIGIVQWAFSIAQGKHNRSGSKEKTCRCGRFVGEVGSAPIERGRWFSRDGSSEKDTADAALDIRHKIDTLCPSPSTQATSKSIRPDLLSDLNSIVTHYPPVQVTGTAGPLHNKSESSAVESSAGAFHLLIFQRDLDRRFLGLGRIVDFLRHQLGSSWRVSVIRYNDNVHPCTLAWTLKTADVLLTTHGFQSTGILFMRLGALIYEVFPYRYFKIGYQELASEYGVAHSWTEAQSPASLSRAVLRLTSTEACMKSRKCRSFARKDDVRLSDSQLQEICLRAKASVSRPAHRM